MAEMALLAFGGLEMAGAASAGAVAAEGLGAATVAAMADGAALGAGGWSTAVVPAAASAGTGSLFSMGTVGSVLQGVMTAGSMLSSKMAADQAMVTGRQQQAQAQIDAELSTLEGDRAALESRAKADEIRRQTLQRIAANRVAFAGSGLDISSGQLSAIESGLQSEADYALSLEAGKQDMARAEARLFRDRTLAKGQNAMSSARSKSSASLVDAGVEGAKGLLSIVKRG